MNSTKKALKQQRQFFILIMIALFCLGVWKSLQGKDMVAYRFFTAGIVLATLEFVFHSVAVGIFKGWMAFAHVLGKIQTTLLTTLIYYLLIVPISFFARRHSKSGAAFIKTARAKQSSWVPAAPPSSPESYYKQF